jgi:hypothetical protein
LLQVGLADFGHPASPLPDFGFHSSQCRERRRNAAHSPLFIDQERGGREGGIAMNERENQNPGAGSESDISKSQSGQQPASGQQSDRAPRESEQTGDQAATGQAQSDQSSQDQTGQSSADQAGFGETATQQRSDVEGSSIGQQPTGGSESGFVGSEGSTDTSSELVKDGDEDKDFSKDGQGAPEGK